MKRAMISQPMNGLDDEKINKVRSKAKTELEKLGFEVINTFFSDSFNNDQKIFEKGVVNEPLFYLAKSLEIMSTCDAVYFCSGYERARGCRIEHEAARAYGLTTLYEEE